MSAFKRYFDEIHDHFGYLATWLPNTRLELGDVGTQDGASFKRLTSLRDLKLPFTTRRGRDLLDFTHTSSTGVRIGSKLDASAGPTGAACTGGLSIELSEEGAFVFRATNCRIDEIGDKLGLGAVVLEACRAGMWDASWRIVDEVVHAESATIIVSNSAKAALSLSANTPIQLSNIAQLDTGIAVSAQQGDVLAFVAAKGLSPLFKLIGVKQSFFSKVFGGSMTFGGAPPTTAPPSEPIDEDPFERYLECASPPGG